MSFDATNFLRELFEAAPSATTPCRAPEAVDIDPDHQQQEQLPGDRFDSWAPRPDAAGNVGWESPDLPAADRWWARQTFDQLPEPPRYPPGKPLASHAVHLDGDGTVTIVDMLEPKEN